MKSQDTLTFVVPCIETCDTSVCVPVTVENFTEIWAFSYTMEWDETILRFDSLGGFNLPNMNANNSFDTSSAVANGFYTAAWVIGSPPGVTRADGDTIYNVYFTVLGNTGDSTIIRFIDTPTDIVAGNPTTIPVDTVSCDVKIGDSVPPDLECPDDVLIPTANPSETINSGLEPKTLNDACDMNVDLSFTLAGATVLPSTSGNANGQTFNATPNNGVTTVTYTAEDDLGNTSMCDFTVTINQIVDSLRIFTESDTAFCSDTIVEIDFNVFNFNALTGLQFSIVWDEDVLGFVDVTNFNLPFLDINSFGIMQIGDGILTFSWIDIDLLGVTRADGDSIFTVVFNVVGNPGDSTFIDVTDTPTDYFAAQGPMFSPYPVDDEDMFNGLGVFVDNPPVINCPPSQSVNTDMGVCTATVTWSDPTVTDDCDMPTPMPMQIDGSPSGSSFTVGIDTVKYKATDSAMQSDTCTFIVTVVDNELPQITCPADLSTTTNTDCTATGVNLGTATVTDNCPSLSVANDAPAAFPKGPTTVTYTATDASGNSATCTQTVTVTDDDPPTITCPADVAATTNTGCTATGVALGTATATDNCSPPDAAPTIANNAPAVFPLGTTTVTYTTTDGAGLAATCTQDVVVTDDDPPNITCPADITVSTDTDCTATNVALGTTGATDNCTAPMITNDAPAIFPLGTTTVTHTATDGAGLTTTCTQDITVTDDDPPVITCPTAVSTTTNNGCTATGVALGMATATDNCVPPNLAPVITNDAPVAFPLGMTTVTYTATASDGTGLTATCTQTVTVTDDDSPTIACPADLTIAINANCEATLDDYTSMASVSDNCSLVANITVDQVPMSGTVISADTDVTLTATDESGNSADCSFKVVIDDQTDPTALCFSDTTVYLDDMGTVSIDTSYVNNGSFDNCPTLALSIDQNTFNCSDIGDNTVTLTVTDGNGNSATCTTNVIVADTIPPQLVTCASDTFLLADANCEAVLPDLTSLTVFSDNCTPTGDLKITQVPPSGTTITNDTTVAVVALDSVGLVSDTCFFLVELVDSVPPTIACPADIAIDASLDSCGTTVFWPVATVDDNCGIGTVICNPASGSFFPVGDSIVTCIVTDMNNNADTCMFTVTVNDVHPPFLECPSDTTIFITANVTNAIIFNIGLDSLSDNCMVDTFFHSFSGAMMGGGDGDASGTSFVPGETTVTYTAVDDAGNTESCSFVVNILQSVIIDLACPGDYIVSTDAGQCSAVVNTAAPSVDPVSGVDTIYYVLTGATTDSGPNSVAVDQVFNIGTTTVTYTAVSITNDTSTCSFTVTIVDQEDPVITCPTTPIELDNTTDSCGVVFDGSLELATATDNCPGVQVTYSIVSGALLPVGTNTITATATDQGMNSVACTYEVMVRDTQPPMISPCPADIMVNNDPGICGAAVTWTPPTATDNCEVLFIEPTPYEPGDVIPVGTEFITYTASDNTGNITECIFSVTVRDNEPPNLNPCPGNITVSNDPGECSAVVTWPFIQPTDNCNVVSFVVLPQSGSVFPIGNTPVQAVATDAAGNVTVCSFTVTVNDTEFPTMNNFPGNITVNNDPGICGAVVTWGAIQVNDNCEVDTFYCNMNSGDMFPAGMTTVECTVIDENGNAFTDDFTVTVIDNEDPQVTCPQDILIFVDGSVVDDPSNFIADFQAVSCDSVILNYNNLTTDDNCAVASISQTVGPISGSIFEAGQQIITYSIQDINANEVVCSFTIDVEGVPDATAGASPNNPCEGGEVLFFTQNTPGAAYEWVDPNGLVISTDASFTLADLTLSMSGTYEVTITYPFGCVQKANVDVDVFPNPELTIMSNDLLCAAAGTPLILEAVDGANSNIVSYQWSTPGGALFIGNPITVTSPLPGNYSVVATTANGCLDTASIFVEISIVPETPDLIGPAEACIGEPILLDGEEFSGPGIMYHWAADPDLATAGINDINNHNNEANPTLPGTYTYYFFVTQGGCVSDSAEWVVVVEDFPSFQDTIIGSTTCVDGTTDVTITAVNAMAGLTWSIDGPCGSVQQDSLFTFSNINASCSGIYTLTATSAIGCSTSETVSLDITDKPVTPILQATSDTICMGGSTTLFLTNTPSGANLLCYENGIQVSCNIIGNAIQPGLTTEYGVQFDINGCTSDITSIIVTVEAPIDIQITPIGDVTCVSGTDTVSLVTQAGGGTYVWDGPCGVQVGNELLIPNIDPGCSGLYSVSVTGALGQCLSIGELQLEVTGMLEPVMAVQQGAACEGGDVSFCAEPEIVGATYTWTDPFGNIFSNERCPNTPAIQASTPYSVEVDLDGCTSSDDILVNVLTAPVANDETVIAIVDAPQSFNVVVNDVLANDNYTISVIQDPANGNVSYNGEGVFTYRPDRGFRQTDIMAYEICYDSCQELCDIAIVTIEVRYPVDQCIATTVITPNEDGINDEFVVSCLELGGCPSNQLFIFNQWGDQVFEAAPYDNTWEGTYNGKDLPDGTYYYIFKCDNSSPAEKGFVVIHR